MGTLALPVCLIHSAPTVLEREQNEGHQSTPLQQRLAEGGHDTPAACLDLACEGCGEP